MKRPRGSTCGGLTGRSEDEAERHRDAGHGVAETVNRSTQGKALQAV